MRTPEYLLTPEAPDKFRAITPGGVVLTTGLTAREALAFDPDKHMTEKENDHE